MEILSESALTWIDPKTRIEGRIFFDQVARFHGALLGEAHAAPGSTLILCESAIIEGNIFADTLLIDGYVHGNIEAKTRVVVSRSGRVLGNIQSPSLQLDFGAYFEGECRMLPSENST